MFAFHEHPVTGLDTAISPAITTPVPGRVSNAGKRQEPRNTRTFQAVGPVTKSVGKLDNVRYVRREIGVAKFPLGTAPSGHRIRDDGAPVDQVAQDGGLFVSESLVRGLPLRRWSEGLNPFADGKGSGYAGAGGSPRRAPVDAPAVQQFFLAALTSRLEDARSVRNSPCRLRE